MGFYLRKSIRVGPLRFNLSKSGIGVSAGIKGLRVGTGPRGNYIHMGRHGVYYRATLPTGTPTQRTSQRPASFRVPVTEEPLTEIESASVLEMVDSSSSDLLRELNDKRQRIRLWPIAAIVGVIVLLLIGTSEAPTWLVVLISVLLAGCVGLAYYRDELTKSVVLFYELDPEAEKAYEALHRAFDRIAACSRTWHIEAKGAVSDWKRNARASELNRRKSVQLSKSTPPYVKTNAPVPTVPVGRQTLYFMPDRILVVEANAIGAVAYDEIDIARRLYRFIEADHVPRDAQIVDHTWRYVNKKGGPDKRFKDNRQLPVVLYEQLHFLSTTGLNEVVMLSHAGAGAELETVLTGSELARIASGSG